MRTPLLRGALIALPAAVLLGTLACSDRSPIPATAPSTTDAPQVQADIPPGPGPNTRQVDVEYFELCKDYSTGSGPNVTFDVSVDMGSNGGADQTFQVTLTAGECRDIWLKGGSPGDIVSVTENVPTGYTASYTKTALSGGSTTTTGPVQASSASGSTSGTTGTLVVFLNTPIPQEGGEGCTPGYWKQSQHFDSWTAPYTPTTQFSAVFDDAFPGKTLLDVLKLGGGGLNALGRHTVAALLNAASSDVDYNLTTADVISQFNAVFPGGDYEGLKNTFAGFNEQTCPVN
jgi:hypothetical protein